MINNFEEKVQSMTAKEIIMAMVQSLRNPLTKIDMGTFGNVKGGVCYGCAATNFICNVGKITLEEFILVEPDESMMGFANNKYDMEFLSAFEESIDRLRVGSIYSYNYYARKYGYATIEDNGIELPVLRNDFSEEDLEKYVELAMCQK